MVLEYHLSVGRLSNYLPSRYWIRSKQPYVRVFRVVRQIKSVGNRVKNAIRLSTLGIFTGHYSRFRLLSQNKEITCCIGQIVIHVILSRCGSLLRCHPVSLSFNCRPECTKFNTLWLRQGSVLLNFDQTLADTWVKWIVNIDVGAWTWVGGFYWFIARTDIAGTKRHSNGLFLQQSLLDVLVFPTFFVMSWAWYFNEGLFGKGRIQFVLPHVTSSSWAEKWVCVCCALLIVRGILGWNASLASQRARIPMLNLLGVVKARSWKVWLLSRFLVFAVGYFTQEDWIVSTRVEHLLSMNIQRFILARTWKRSVRLFVFSFIYRFKNLSFRFTGREVIISWSSACCIRIWVIQSRAHFVLTHVCVCIGSKFASGYADGYTRWNNNDFWMNFLAVCAALSISWTSVTHKFKRAEMSAWTWILDISWCFKFSASGNIGAKSVYFSWKWVHYFVLTCGNKFYFLCCISTWTRIFVYFLNFFSLNQRIEWCNTKD